MAACPGIGTIRAGNRDRIRDGQCRWVIKWSSTDGLDCGPGPGSKSNLVFPRSIFDFFSRTTPGAEVSDYLGTYCTWDGKGLVLITTCLPAYPDMPEPESFSLPICLSAARLLGALSSLFSGPVGLSYAFRLQHDKATPVFPEGGDDTCPFHQIPISLSA